MTPLSCLQQGEELIIPILQMGKQSQGPDAAGEQQAQEGDSLIHGEPGGPRGVLTEAAHLQI